jgi:hypothetical protein
LPELVRTFVTDERNEPLYNPELLSSEKTTDGAVGLGTRFHTTHKQGQHAVDMEVEVTGYDRPRRMASRTTMAWSDIDGQFTFQPVAAGTRMHWDWDVRPKGLWKAMTPLIGLVGGRSEKACWEGLKRYLGAERAAAT